MQVDFNSIKVRLKLDINPQINQALSFQIHKGTIKTKNEYDRFATDFISIP